MLANSRVSAILPAENLTRARKFYEEVLGLKVKDEDLGEGHVMYEAGQGTMLVVYERGRTKAEHTAAGFWVDNLEETMAGLRTKGLVFEEYDFPGLKTVNGIATIGKTKSAWFKDPEGNIIGLTEM